MRACGLGWWSILCRFSTRQGKSLFFLFNSWGPCSLLIRASLFGRAGSGFAGDKIGRYNVFIIVCYLTGVWILALWIPAVNDGARIAFAALFGFASGAYVAILPALVVQISPMSEIGFRVGLSFLACALPGLTTNPIGGAILERTSSWVEPKVFAGVMALAGTTFVLAARIKATGWKLTAVF